MRDVIPGWDRAYPVPASTPDRRFSEDLVNQTAALLVAHGYPPLSHLFEWGELELALWDFLYGERKQT
ncbi:hypothetical protein [Streptomyces sp. NPDC017993]|uniref:hypothetical protein n=1 Tax=Streptomyces sp. NPDC017993 TaxID=3365027 RepID=UPI0037AF9765